MIHIKYEGFPAKQGLNVYGWSVRKYHIGFVLRIRDWNWVCRYAPHVKKFYCYTKQF